MALERGVWPSPYCKRISLEELSEPSLKCTSGWARDPKRGPGASALSDPRLYKYLNVIVKGEDAVREVVRVNAEMGVDWIKTRTGGTASSPGGWDPKTEVYTLEEITALVEQASAHGIPVACHAHGEHVINNAIHGGCRTIEHGYYITEANLRLMREHGTIWNPTYTSVEGYMFPHDDYNSSASRMRAPWALHNMRMMLAIAHELGVEIITSTDTQYGPQSDTGFRGDHQLRRICRNVAVRGDPVGHHRFGVCIRPQRGDGRHRGRVGG